MSQAKKSDAEYTAKRKSQLVALIKEREKARKEKLENMESVSVSLFCKTWCIYDINNVRQTFSALFEVRLWRELTLHEMTEYLYNSNFEPKLLYFWPISAVEVIQKERNIFSNGKDHFIRCKYDKLWVVTRTLCNVTFAAQMNLKNFPFDVQHYEIGLHFGASLVYNAFC